MTTESSPVDVNSIHHVEFVVYNAVQSAFWYCSSFGFQRFAQRTADNSVSYALKNGQAIVVVTSYTSNNPHAKKLMKHGDFILNITFEIDDHQGILQTLDKAGVKYSVITECDTEGSIKKIEIIQENSDVLHTVIELKHFNGVFLPGYEAIEPLEIFQTMLAAHPKQTKNEFRSRVPVILMDHVVLNFPIGEMETAADWYTNTLKLKRFWSVDDKIATSQYSAMRAWLMVNESHDVQITLAEGVKGRKGKSQIEEFIDFHGGSGVQHFALLVDDIISAVELMKSRSVDFLTIPDTYYDLLEERLNKTNLEVKEDLQKIRKLNILMDFDENGYLLQIFTKPMQDRPTLFVEIIQRNNFKGFGAGNFKALFDAVEIEQAKRGTLY